jgi:hypothetical protein
MGLNLFLFGITWQMKSLFSLDGEYQPIKRVLEDLESSSPDRPHGGSGGESGSGPPLMKMSVCSVSSVDMDREKVRSISVA